MITVSIVLGLLSMPLADYVSICIPQSGSGFHHRVFSSDLQGMQLYQLENGVRGAGAWHCQSVFKKDGGMYVSATQPARAHRFSPFCPLPAHARGRRTLACACVRELSAAMAPGQSSSPSSQSWVRCRALRQRNGSSPPELGPATAVRSQAPAGQDRRC